MTKGAETDLRIAWRTRFGVGGGVTRHNGWSEDAEPVGCKGDWLLAGADLQVAGVGAVGSGGVDEGVSNYAGGDGIRNRG